MNKQRLIIIFWFIAIAISALCAWEARHSMNPDGVSYLDMGDAYLRGDWNTAINTYWSPLYSWLLGLALHIFKPSAYWEFSIVHLVNFVIYIFALGCFHFFLFELSRYQRNRKLELSRDGIMTLPEWALLTIGYTLFIWSSLKFITLVVVTPDMLVAAFLYLASGILLRIRMNSTDWLTFIILGIILGFGYLTKEIMFLLAFVFLGTSLLLIGDFQRVIWRVFISLVVFLLIGSPLIVALSNAKGNLTFGSSGKVNYAWHVSSKGKPIHPPRKLLDMPQIYEFGTPIGGTYPLWYDPSYWNEGIVPHFNLGMQLNAITIGIKKYFDIFFNKQGSLIIGALILYLMGRRKWLWLKDIAEYRSLLIPAISGLCIYSLVLVDLQYIAPFALLLWIGIFSAVRLPDSQKSKRLVKYVVLVMLIPMIISLSLLTAKKIYSITHDLSSHVHWQIANILEQKGIYSEDKVAYIGHSWDAFPYWARLARIQVIAEIPDKHLTHFWMSDDSVKSKIINIFLKTGAKAIIARNIESYILKDDWQKIGNTNYYVYILKKQG